MRIAKSSHRPGLPARPGMTTGVTVRDDPGLSPMLPTRTRSLQLGMPAASAPSQAPLLRNHRVLRVGVRDPATEAPPPSPGRPVASY